MLERTPAPYGKPGGPGLYDVHGLSHGPYFQQIVKALMTKRGMDKGRASAIAYGALRKWSKGGGHVTPEVAAAATGALAKEAAAGARAKAVHGHARTWGEVGREIDLATVIELFNPAQPRLPVGPGGGQFTTGSGGGQSGQQQQGKGGQAKQKPMTPAQAHAAHVAHVAHLNHVSTAKAKLLVQAQDARQQADALIKQRDALAKSLASASGKTSSGQAGAKTASTAKTKSTAPATAKSTTATAAPAKTSSTTASTAKTSTTAKTTSTTASTAAKAATGTAAVKAQIAQLNTQIVALQAQYKQAMAQAAGMK